MSGKIAVEMRVNGETVRAEVPPRMLLVDFIRDVLGLTGGTHIGCDTSTVAHAQSCSMGRLSSHARCSLCRPGAMRSLQ